MLSPILIIGGWLVDVLRELAMWGGVLLLLASSLSFYTGWKQRRKAALVTETPRTAVADVESAGVTRIRGTVVPKFERDTFTSPVKGDRECVLAAWEIEELYDTSKTRSWESAASGVHSVPFYIQDESGKLLIDIDDRVVGNETDEVFTPERFLEPDGVSLEGLWCEFDSFDVHVETGYEESPPPRVADFVDSTQGIRLDPMATEWVVDASKRQYYEQTLQQGDKVSVLGYATPRHDVVGSATHPDRFIMTGSEESTLHLSTHPFDDVSRGGGGLLFGLLTGLAGLGLITAVVLM
ncbi:hypothetical protein ACERIT_03140 [Halopenitus sp. H-Gu1]|uniref:hypothetical protein n=1 Tax=Halopenitus sp. H-Gu1 TaxID=3242697 RepID=UPI00359D6C86